METISVAVMASSSFLWNHTTMVIYMIRRYRSIKLERFQFVGRERNLILWCTLTDEAQPSLELSYFRFFEQKVRVVQ